MPKSVVVSTAALMVLGVCAGAKGEPTVFDNQTPFYIVHRATKASFKVDKVGGTAASKAFRGTAETMGGVDLELGEQVEKRLGLQDPVSYSKERLAEVLRRDLNLTNVQVLSEPLTTPLLANELSDEARRRNAPTFQRDHRAGVVIEVVTRYWGVADFKATYRATATFTNLTDSTSFAEVACNYVKPLGDRQKLEAQINAKFDAYERLADYTAAVEGLLYPNNGELLKTSLQSLAAGCGGELATRLRQRARF